MQESDHVIVADLSLSLPLRQRPYLGRVHPLGHDDGVVAHVRGIRHDARLRQVWASVSGRHAPSPNCDRHVLDLRRNDRTVSENEAMNLELVTVQRGGRSKYAAPFDDHDGYTPEWWN